MRLLRNTILLVLPYLIIVLVNETYRPTIKGSPYSVYEATAMNSDVRNLNTCSWVAHSDTSYCKQHHVKFLSPYLPYTDRIYFGVIGAFIS